MSTLVQAYICHVCLRTSLAWSWRRTLRATTSVICQFSYRLPNDFPDLLDLSPVSRDFGREFRLQWPGWMFCWVLRICPKVGYEWFPYHPRPLWVLLGAAQNAVSTKLATRGNFSLKWTCRSCTMLCNPVQLLYQNTDVPSTGKAYLKVNNLAQKWRVIGRFASRCSSWILFCGIKLGIFGFQHTAYTL